MNHETARQWILERLEGRLSPEQAARLEAYLQQHPELARECQAVQESHAWLQSQMGPEPSSETGQRIRQQARQTPALPPRWFTAKTWAAAAVLVFSLGLSALVYLDPMQSQGPQPATLSEKTTAPTDRNASNQEAQPFQVQTTTSSSANSGQEAEALFRDGLAVYNRAFRKVGEEKATLLQSAVLILDDVPKLFPAQKDWAALALTITADAHREMGQPQKAIEAYQRLLSAYAQRQPIAQQARASLIRLLLQQNQNQAAADELGKLKPAAGDFSEATALTLTLAKQSQAQAAHIALAPLQQLAETMPPTHLLYGRIQAQQQTTLQQVLQQNTLREWLYLAPLSLNTPPHEAPHLFAGHQVNHADSIHSKEGQLIQWKIYAAPPNQAIRLIDLLDNVPLRSSAYLKTWIQSGHAQNGVLFIQALPAMRIWLNQQEIQLTNTSEIQTHPIHLQTGANQLVVQCQSRPENGEAGWPIALAIQSAEGNFLQAEIQMHKNPDLIIDR